MKLSINEIKKLFDFILINKNIILSDDSLFSRDTLIMLRDIIKGKRPNDFELSKEQEEMLIEAFKSSDFIFDDDTPRFIISDYECVNIVIERDINSVNYIIDFIPELETKVINLAIDNNYILQIDSPLILRSNYTIALNSIRQNPRTADYVAWGSIPKEVYDALISKVIESGYVLSQNSAAILRDNLDIVLHSIAKDIKTLRYASNAARNNIKVFKYLLLNGYEFSDNSLEIQPLVNYADKDIMVYVFNHFIRNKIADFDSFFENYPDKIAEYIDRFGSLFSDAIKMVPTISSFNSIFQFSADTEWEDYKNDNLNDYANIFGKICAELQANNSFDDAFDNLNFLYNMEDVLGDKYNLLLQAMKEYHDIIHSNWQLYNLDNARNQIASLSALYISMSKENYKKELLEEYQKILTDYFIPRKDHPIVYKKIMSFKRKETIKNLYNKEDSNFYFLLNDIVKKYSKVIDEDILWEMIDNFITKDYSKLDSFMQVPLGFSSYKRYKEASKLVNRLNSNYIKYTDSDLLRYLDIIKYDNKKGKYCYVGPTFSIEDIGEYNRYLKKQKVFEDIKRKIVAKANSLVIEETITEEELLKIKDTLPFNDDYYEFDPSYLTEYFNLKDFMNSCITTDDIIEPSSLLNDETYNVLYNYVINNRLVWFLLFLNQSDNIELEKSYDKQSLLEDMDSMGDIVNLAKKFNYSLNGFKDIASLTEISEFIDEETLAILGKDIIARLCKNKHFTDEDSEEIIKTAKELICQMVKKDKSTVPYIGGETINYKYSLYDSQDVEILLSGLNTDACFRVDGTDNDFLHYCALNKNGLVIKITDDLGNFIARASGFRNGNAVYINQLRTIYDEGEYGYTGNYSKERAEIIEAFKKACNDIVDTSQNNKEENYKIDFVFVTRSYALSKTPSNVDRDVENKIGSKPMVSNSSDWINFVNNTDNLMDCTIKDGFSIDYGRYSLICVASSKLFGKIRPRDIKPKDVDAIYQRPRNKIIATNKPSIDVLNKINRIRGIYSYLNHSDFKCISLPKDTLVFVGDNWYIAYFNSNIVSSIILDFDQKAKLEYEITKQRLEEYTRHNMDMHEFSKNLEDDYARVLRIK